MIDSSESMLTLVDTWNNVVDTGSSVFRFVLKTVWFLTSEYCDPHLKSFFKMTCTFQLRNTEGSGTHPT